MKLLLITALLIITATVANAQSVDCPVDKVCITRDQAVQALQDRDTVEAQKTEIRVKDQAIDDLKKEVFKMQIELAKAIGEKTGAEQMVVRLSAVLDIALKNTRKRCAPFSICL